MANQPNELQQFSYDPLKSIVKYSELEKRAHFATQIRGLKKTEALFPYHYDKIRVDKEFFEIEKGDLKRSWMIHKLDPNDPEELHWRPEEPGEKTRFTHSMVLLGRDRRNVSKFQLNKTYDVPMLKLLKWFLRNGSTVDHMCIFGVPLILAELGSIKLKVKKIWFDSPTQDVVQQWLSVISDDEVEEIRFNVTNETFLFMFQEPLIRSCKTLKMRFFTDGFHGEIPLDQWFVDLPNPHIQVDHPYFPMEFLMRIIRKWVDYRLPLGTSFSFGVRDYTTVLDAFDMAAADFRGKPSKFPNVTDYFAHCCTVPVDEQLEIVLFGGRGRTDKQVPVKCYHDWELKVEVMKKGTTVPK